VASIQLQTLDDIEIIFVDDFSKDKTYKYLLRAQKLDPRIKIIKNTKNMGIMYSRMFGALESKGEYVTFLDCDDLYIEPNILKLAYDTAEENDLDIIQYEYIGSTFENGDNYEYLSGYVSKEVYGKIKRNRK
jgi:glycosyltransferase involved in cell wall biosynthesis